jgi:hypothetical protein
VLRRVGDDTAGDDGADGADVLELPEPYADRECCGVLAMLLLVTMVLVC